MPSRGSPELKPAAVQGSPNSTSEAPEHRAPSAGAGCAGAEVVEPKGGSDRSSAS